MRRLLGFAMVASLLVAAGLVRADQTVEPAFFSLASDEDTQSVSGDRTIIQVAAETAIPEPTSDNTDEIDCAPCGYNAAAKQGGSESSRNPSGTSDACDQCASDCCNENCSDGCHDGCSSCCPECYHPLWTFKAGALVLDRVNPRSTALLVETGTGRSLMNADGFSFNWTGGLDVSAIRRIGDDSDLEVRYFGINSWRARQSFFTNTPAEAPIFPPIPVPVGTSVTSQFESSLYSAEVNWRHESNDQLAWLAGFRWLQMHDSLGITVTDATTPSVTDNQLCGGQVGADLQLWDDGSPLHIDSVFKVGLYNNSAENLQQSRDQLAFVGEIGVTAVYQCCDHLALRAGYQLLWLDGVAVASDQVPLINLATNRGIDTTGNAFYHGALFSVDCTW